MSPTEKITATFLRGHRLRCCNASRRCAARKPGLPELLERKKVRLDCCRSALAVLLFLCADVACLQGSRARCRPRLASLGRWCLPAARLLCLLSGTRPRLPHAARGPCLGHDGFRLPCKFFFFFSPSSQTIARLRGSDRCCFFRSFLLAVWLPVGSFASQWQDQV
jgi:hypothetical protein